MASEVVVMTISGAVCDDKVGIMAFRGFQCIADIQPIKKSTTRELYNNKYSLMRGTKIESFAKFIFE